MMHTKKLLLLILPLSSCMALAACSDGSDEDDSTGIGDGDGDGAGGMGGGSGDGDGDGDETPTFAWLDCDGIEVDDAVDVTDNVEEDAEWSGTIRISKDLQVRQDAVLTIQPGTNIVFEPDASLEIGWNSNGSTIFAEGTTENPIRFCGKVSEPGYWGGVIVGRNVTSDSTMKNVLIADAGGDEVALQLSQGITLENVQVRGSGADGVWATDFDDDSTMLSVDGAEGFPVVLIEDEAVDHFPLGGTFEENGDNRLALRMSVVDSDTMFSEPGIPYFQEKNLQIREGASAEFEAGVDYQFAADTTLEVGWNSNEAEILVMGTEEAPVMFHGSSNTSGYWGGIIIQRNVLTTSSIQHAVIADAGGEETAALRIAAVIEISDVLLTGNDTGALIGEQGLKTSSENLSITETAGVPLTVEANGAITLPEGGDFTGNDTDRIVILAGAFEKIGTIPNLGVPYLISGNITTRTDSELTLTAGTTFIMAADAYLEIGWNSNIAKFTAVGTAAEPIVFVGDQEEPGYWEGIRIGRNVTSDSKLSYVNISHGGGAEGTALDPVRANLWLDRAVDVSDCIMTMSSTYGIVKQEDDPTDYSADNDLSGNAFDGVFDQ